MKKPTLWFVCRAKTQISLGTECTQWVAEDPMFLHADSKDSDQTERSESSMGAKVILSVLSWGGSNAEKTDLKLHHMGQKLLVKLLS